MSPPKKAISPVQDQELVVIWDSLRTEEGGNWSPLRPGGKSLGSEGHGWSGRMQALGGHRLVVVVREEM